MRYLFLLILFLPLGGNTTGIVKGRICTENSLKGANNDCCQSTEHCGVRTNSACCGASGTLSNNRNACYWGSNKCWFDSQCDDVLSCNERHTSACCTSKSGCTWDTTSNTCKRGCTSTTRSNCVLTGRGHDIGGYNADTGWSGSCRSGYTGECRYYCDDSDWVKNRNTCTLYVPSNCTHGNSRCTYKTVNHGRTRSYACKSGYTGSCTYRCNDNTMTITHTCKRQCNYNTEQCTLPRRNHGQTVTGSCASGYAGPCRYYCNDGNWNRRSQCTRACTLKELKRLCGDSDRPQKEKTIGIEEYIGGHIGYCRECQIFRQTDISANQGILCGRYNNRKFFRCSNNRWVIRTPKNCSAYRGHLAKYKAGNGSWFKKVIDIPQLNHGQRYTSRFFNNSEFSNISFNSGGVSVQCRCNDGRVECSFHGRGGLVIIR